jgi:predicted MFS family arabinose efflux permease
VKAPGEALADTRHREKRYKNHLLGVLVAVLACNYMDRLIFGVVLQDIKRDLDLTDTELGLLGGLAFALFYATMGLPLARWADRGNRVTIMSLTVALWSAATAMCGAASSFIQLFFIRVGVAIGEAGCYPTANSLIADHFDRAERPRAVARFALGVPLALVVGYFASGWLNQLYGWRATFVILGLPGLVLALLVATTLKDPRPTKASVASDAARSPDVAPRLNEVFAVLWRNGSYRHLLFCFAVWGFFGNGIHQWQPTFFVRSHGLQTGELGSWFAIVYGIGGFAGTWLGGELAARYAAGNERRQLVGVAWMYAVLGLFTAAAYAVSDYRLAFLLLGIATLGGAMGNGPIFATAQTLVQPRMRAMSIALMYFFCNLIGLGLGPLAAGAMSDLFRPWLGDDALRYALLALCPGYLWCSWHLWCASRNVIQDIPTVRVDESPSMAL